MHVSQYCAKQNCHFRKDLRSGYGFQEVSQFFVCLDDVCNALKNQTGGQTGGVQGLFQPGSSLTRLNASTML